MVHGKFPGRRPRPCLAQRQERPEDLEDVSVDRIYLGVYVDAVGLRTVDQRPGVVEPFVAGGGRYQEGRQTGQITDVGVDDRVGATAFENGVALLRYEIENNTSAER